MLISLGCDLDPRQGDELTEDELVDAYNDACDRAEYAEFVLLVYHHLVCLFDADEVREKYPMAPPLATQWGSPAQLPSKGERPDTEKTLYRHNHIDLYLWEKMNYSERRAWVVKKAMDTGKSVVE